MTPEKSYLYAWRVWGATTVAAVVLGFMTADIKGALSAFVSCGAISAAVLGNSARGGSNGGRTQ